MAKRMSKHERKKRRIRAVLIVIIVVAILAFVVGMLRKKVTSQVNEGNTMPVSAAVERGSISNTVSGSGNLTDEAVEAVTIHGDVEVTQLLVEAGETVAEGDLLATVNMPTVLSAMAQVQSQINDLDQEIGEASDQELDDTVQATLPGRLMVIFAREGDDVSAVMYEHGTLALLSLDGYLQVEIETDALNPGDCVSVVGESGKTLEGVVDAVTDGVACILISDEKAAYGETVTVSDAQGNLLGTGSASVHQPLKITGVSGTVKAVKVEAGQSVKAGKTLLTLTNTSFSANYLTLLEQRQELEEQLQSLIQIYRDGGVLARLSGIVSSLETQSATGTAAQSGYGSFQTEEAGTATEQTLLSVCPGTKMTVSISVDETDILSLELGQQATVSVEAIGGEAVSGTVTEIDTTATSSGGVTVYTVTVSFDKTESMLAGMTANVSIVIEGVEDALLIPSEALTQTRDKSYVYTSYNAQTGELGTMIEVTTGMNNGSYVEITGGLQEGDTVYYFEEEETGFGFGGGNMPGGNFGGGFGGGNMPGGDFGGGFGGNMPGGSSGGTTGERPGGNFGGRGQ